MTFILPQAMFALLLAPLFAGAYILMQRRRRRYALRYASVALVRDAVGRGPGLRRHIPPLLFLLALVAGTVALARPQVVVAQHQDRGVVMLSVDVSGSMVADDVKPTRMAALQDAVKNFIQQEPDGVQVGLVAFSDTARLLQPPTADKAAVTAAADKLHAVGGTDMGDGLRVALDAIYSATDIPRPQNLPNAQAGSPSGTAAATTPPAADTPAAASIVLVSDGGANLGPPPLNVAQEAAAAGIKVYTVGIGTAQGTVLHIQGQSVLTRLDENTLQGIASATGGQYLNAQTESQLSQVYSQLALQQHVENTPVEVTFLAASGALLLMVLAAALSLLWFNRLP
jgi:Ca-activated chloride channel family protein